MGEFYLKFMIYFLWCIKKNPLAWQLMPSSNGVLLSTRSSQPKQYDAFLIA
jgi:hypothetical protein